MLRGHPSRGRDTGRVVAVQVGAPRAGRGETQPAGSARSLTDDTDNAVTVFVTGLTT